MPFNSFEIKARVNGKWEDVEVYDYQSTWRLVETYISQASDAFELPQFIIDGMQSYISTLPTNNNFKFAWWSDPQTQVQSMVYKAEELSFLNNSEAVDLLVYGGDITDGNANKSIAVSVLQNSISTSLRRYKKDIFPLVGNHDTNFYSWNVSATPEVNRSLAITPPEFHEIALAHLEGNVTFSPSRPNGCYYYKDYTDKKIRVISLNTSDFFDNNNFVLQRPVNVDVRQEQFTWFCNVALNFMDKPDRASWGIVILSHGALMTASGALLGSLVSEYQGGTSFQNGLQFRGVIKAFKEGGTFSMTSNSGGDFQIISSVNFATQGAMKVVCNVHGHAHLDRVWYYEGIPTIGVAGMNPNTRRTSYPETDPSITVATSPYRGNLDGSPTRYTDPYPTSQLINALFDTFEVDMVNDVIYAKRFGAGVNRVIPFNT